MSESAHCLRRRWGDNDKYLGPLTYAKNDGWKPIAMILESGDDEYAGTSFRVSAFGHTLILALPQWVLRPYSEKVRADSWDAATVKRLGRDWYWSIDRRAYGFSISDGHLSVSLGRQTMDSSTEQSWGCFLPWTQWRHVRRSFYGLDGEHVASVSDGDSKLGSGFKRWERERAIADATPTISFKFDDYDGETITATTMIEEREWHFGTGWFKWLSVFRRPKISRSLDLDFSSEVGRRKGSWKGGTTGHAIEMNAGELHESAFRRYCDENELTFLGAAKQQDQHQ